MIILSGQSGSGLKSYKTTVTNVGASSAQKLLPSFII
jgi:hypothetical protein